MQKLRLTLLALMLVVAIGTVGFIILEGMNPLDALYMTIITLSTVGFREVIDLDERGKVFVIFLIMIGVVMAGYTTTVIAQLVLEGHFKEVFGKRRMETKISKLKEHFIVAGYGRVGRQVVAEFTRANAPFVVVEKNEDALERLQGSDTLFVRGEATDDHVLRKAGIERARTLISTLPDEAQNVYLTLTARDINPELNIIARADYEDGEKKLMRAGADHVISPHVLGGQRMAMASLRPNIVDFMHSTALGEGGTSIEEMVIPPQSKLVGKTLLDSGLKQQYGVSLVGIKHAGKKLTIGPSSDTTFKEGDTLVLIGETVNLERLSRDLIS